MTLSLGISPCPNDTYIFYALLNNRIAHNLDIELIMEDIGVLNTLASNSSCDIVKMSFNAYSKLQTHYDLLDAGGALGHGCGPLVLAREDYELDSVSSQVSVAIPGKNTTANLLMKLAFPQLENKEELLFSEIEHGVQSGKYDLGLVIHESRFTYEKYGLRLVMDLGEYWESKTFLPIPLGGIFAKKNLDPALKKEFTDLIRKSINYARENEEETLEYCRQFAQEMNKEVMLNHIDLYVNDYSISYGAQGQKAVKLFLEEAKRVNSSV